MYNTIVLLKLQLVIKLIHLSLDFNSSCYFLVSLSFFLFRATMHDHKMIEIIGYSTCELSLTLDILCITAELCVYRSLFKYYYIISHTLTQSQLHSCTAFLTVSLLNAPPVELQGKLVWNIYRSEITIIYFCSLYIQLGVRSSLVVF